MFRHFQNRRKKGQSTLEYAILIIIIIAALMTIQSYIKRGIQGRLRSAADDIGDQFDPGATNSTIRTTTGSTQTEVNTGGNLVTSYVNGEVTTTTQKDVILNQQQTFWGN